MITTTLTARRKIHVPQEQVWDLLQDPQKIWVVHPLVKSVQPTQASIHSPHPQGRHCQLFPMGTLQEEVKEIESDDHCKRLVMQANGGNVFPFFKFLESELRLDRVSSQTTQVRFQLKYQVKWGGLGLLINTLFIWPFFLPAPHAYLWGVNRYFRRPGH